MLVSKRFLGLHKDNSQCISKKCKPALLSCYKDLKIKATRCIYRILLTWVISMRWYFSYTPSQVNYHSWKCTGIRGHSRSHPAPTITRLVCLNVTCHINNKIQVVKLINFVSLHEDYLLFLELSFRENLCCQCTKDYRHYKI